MAAPLTRPPYEHVAAVGAPRSVLFDMWTNCYYFLYRHNGIWNVDRWSVQEILAGRARFYEDRTRGQFAVVDDLGRVVHFILCQNQELIYGAAYHGGGLPRGHVQTLPLGRHAADVDAEFRDRRAQNQAGAQPPGQPPQPPGGGAALAEGAESRPAAERQQAAPVHAAAALLAWAEPEAALAAGPAVAAAAADGGTGGPPATDEQEPPAGQHDGVAALRALLAGARPANPWVHAVAAAAGPEDPWTNTYRRWRDPAVDLLTAALLIDASGIRHARVDPWADPWGDEAAAVAPRVTAKPQKYVADLVIADKIRQGACCAITMEPIEASSAACVAPCYHCFEQQAIKEWLRRNDSCPECRQACSL